jgi:hypothetical protein
MENIEEVVIKKPRGHPITSDVKNNKAYFVEYYAKNNKPMICECGQHITSFYLTKHKKQKKHNYLMEIKNLKETLGNFEKIDLEN